MGTEAHSRASTARWAEISPEKRSKMMSKLARSKNDKMTPEARRKHALMMLKAREAKKRKKHV